MRNEEQKFQAALVGAKLKDYSSNEINNALDKAKETKGMALIEG